VIRTRGLTHIALRVADLERSVRFYSDLLGAVPVYRDQAFVQLQTPGTWDVIVLEQGTKSAGKSGGVLHFGFRLVDPADIDRAADAVAGAGGIVTDKGEFVPGEPYVFATDPDGYEIEIWYELPTQVDPSATA
jgi:catechol 2,3-dioxygenase-like lactoylglutathione lyase family enzyme